MWKKRHVLRIRYISQDLFENCPRFSSENQNLAKNRKNSPFSLSAVTKSEEAGVRVREGPWKWQPYRRRIKRENPKRDLNPRKPPRWNRQKEGETTQKSLWNQNNRSIESKTTPPTSLEVRVSFSPPHFFFHHSLSKNLQSFLHLKTGEGAFASKIQIKIGGISEQLQCSDINFDWIL